VINGNVLTVDHNDILSKTSFRQDSDHPVHIIGNLPFNIASPLLLQWLHQRASQEALFSINNDIWLTLMFQKEVGDVSVPNVCVETFINLSLENYRRCIHIKAW
jgi:dimethyladenosine transferase 1